jgi:flagella basal body P-ring formation protein FlgA
MIARIFISLAILAATPLSADTVIAKHTIRAQQIIAASDLAVAKGVTPGAASALEQVAGLEARRVIYAGRPVALSDVGPPALVERNEIVPLAYRLSGLTIKTEGRALGRGGLGDRIRVMNLDSRAPVHGVIDETGTVWVGQ